MGAVPHDKANVEILSMLQIWDQTQAGTAVTLAVIKPELCGFYFCERTRFAESKDDKICANRGWLVQF